MKLADDDNAALAQVLTDYYKAFSTLDAHAVEPYFHEPSQLVSPAGVILTPTRAAVAAAFQPVMDSLRARGFAVTAIDWRGQGLSDRGLSDRHKGYVRDFSEYDLDLEAFMREVVLPDCPPPLFAIGHSTGATVHAPCRKAWLSTIVSTGATTVRRGRRTTRR